MAERLSEEQVVAKLRQLWLRISSIEIDAARCEGGLRDLCPDNRAQQHALVLAVKEEIPSLLWAAAGEGGVGMAEGALLELSARLTEAGLVPELGRWAVEAWAEALGLWGRWARPGFDPVSDALWELLEEQKELLEQPAELAGALSVRFSDQRGKIRALVVACESGAALRMRGPEEGQPLWGWLEAQAAPLQAEGLDAGLARWTAVAVAMARSLLTVGQRRRLRELVPDWKASSRGDPGARSFWHPRGLVTLSPGGARCRVDAHVRWSYELSTRAHDVAPDGSAVALLGDDARLRLVHVATGKLVPLLTDGPVVAFLFSRDGKKIAAEGEAGRVTLFSAGGSRLGMWKTSGEIFFDTAGNLVALDDGQVIDLERKLPRATVSARPWSELWLVKDSKVDDLDFSSDGRLLAAVGKGARGVSLWDTVTGEPLLSWAYTPGEAEPRFVAFCQGDERLLVVDTRDGSALYEPFSERVVGALPPGAGAEGVNSLASAPGGPLLLGGRSGVTLLDAELAPAARSATHASYRARLGAQRQVVVFLGARVSLLSPSLDAVLWSATPEQGVSVIEASVCPDGRVAAAAGPRVHIFDTGGWISYAPLQHEGYLTAMALSERRNQLATATEKHLSLWSLSTGKLVHRKPLDRAISRLRFSPGGNLLACAGPQSLGLVTMPPA